MEKRFLNVHRVVVSTCNKMNADEMGQPKEVIYGGKTRSRVSSQSVKKAIRSNPLYRERLAQTALTMDRLASVRTREFTSALVPYLMTLLPEGTSATSTQEVIAGMRSYFGWGTGKAATARKKAQEAQDAKSDDPAEAEEGAEDGGKVVIPFGLSEFRLLIQEWEAWKANPSAAVAKKLDDDIRKDFLRDVKKEQEKVDKKVAKLRDAGKEIPAALLSAIPSDFDSYKLSPEYQDAFQAGSFSACLKDLEAGGAGRLCNIRGTGLDIALGGRMVASKHFLSVEAAMSLSHMISTHMVQSEDDFFSATDDLTADLGESGAGHTGTVAYTPGAVLYQSFHLNLDQLQANLGHMTDSEILDVVGQLLWPLVQSMPSGKQHTFGSFTLPAAVIIERSSFPLTFADAFETPVLAQRGSGGYLEPTLDRLFAHIEMTRKGYGLSNPIKAMVRGTTLGEIHGIPVTDELSVLSNWIKDGSNA